MARLGRLLANLQQLAMRNMRTRNIRRALQAFAYAPAVKALLKNEIRVVAPSTPARSLSKRVFKKRKQTFHHSRKPQFSRKKTGKNKF